MTNDYEKELVAIRSLLIVTSLQKRSDLKAAEFIDKFDKDIDWNASGDLMINPEVWKYVVDIKGYDPKKVFCHPQVLLHFPKTSLYYRGLCGLSLKAARSAFGALDNLESGNLKARIDEDKAFKMAQTYNALICSVILNSTDWTLENGNRTIIATLGITLDGQMRNKIGDIAEERVRSMVSEWLYDNGLVVSPRVDSGKDLPEKIMEYQLANDTVMRFASEPDISFLQNNELRAVIEIKGGTDPAGALERYGAAKKSFEHAVKESGRCKNFYLAAVFTPELERRIKDDRLVEKSFNIIDILDSPDARKEFFHEVFHHTLRIT